jgi:hypothetical protein
MMGAGLYGAFTITQENGGEGFASPAQAARAGGADLHQAAPRQIAVRQTF